MIRLLLLITGFAFVLACPLIAQDTKGETKATVDLFGSLDDETLMNESPPSSVIASTKAWEKLAKAWGIQNPARVDFDKEILVLATTRGSRLNLSTRLDDQGDLKIVAISTRDLRPGFRYAIKSVSKEGVKTVNGQPLLKE
jgi:hypothetical protein